MNRGSMRGKLERISRMNADEICTRLRQEWRKRTDEVRWLAGLSSFEEPATAAPSAPPRFFFSQEDIPQIAKIFRKQLPQETVCVMEQADKICSRRFDLLGYEDLDFGDPVDWHFDPVHNVRVPRKTWFRIPYLDFKTAGDHKIVWELNRHQHLVTLAKAWLLSGERRYADELSGQWYHWREQNPYPVGINWASSLEVAIRNLSWLWILHLLASCPYLPERFEAELTAAIGRSARHIERFLSTYFAPNTHLLGEAVGLYFTGTLCPQFVSSARWRETGWRIILNETRRQVRGDGMHFEQSVYYHVYALDFFLHARVLAERNQVEIPADLDAAIAKMAGALCGLSQAGAPPRFGDDDGGRVFNPRRNRTEHLLDPLSTAAVLYGRGDFKAAAGELREETLWLLGPEGAKRFDELPSNPPAPRSRAFEESGLYVMTNRKPPAQAIVIDAGPMGAFTAGHGHADALSVQLIVEGRHWLTDPGTYCYPEELAERNRFRGTGAHNTLRVDGRDQAEPAGPFSWNFLPETRAERWAGGETLDLFVGTHSGYRRLAAPAFHQRWVVSWKDGSFLVRDAVTGDGLHCLDQIWRLGPGFRLDQLRENMATFARSGGDALTFAVTEEHGWSCEIAGSEWSGVYGQKTAALAIRYSRRAALPAEFAVLIVPRLKDAARLEQLQGGDGVEAYRVSYGGGGWTACFASGERPWRWQDWSGDAAFVCVSNDAPETGSRRIVMAGGSYLERVGREIVRLPQETAYWEGAVSNAPGSPCRCG